MARNPVIAIVGRPNVGKSTLFNRMLGERVAIEEPTAGVTRDRIIRSWEIEGRPVELIDTGGIGIIDEDALSEDIDRQIEIALAAADAIILVCDARVGLTPADEDVTRRLRRLGRPIVLCANKVDEAHHEVLAQELCGLGLGEPFFVSAIQGFGVSDLTDRVLSVLPEPPEEPAAEPDTGALKVAILGKRNVGKSTFVNALAGTSRVIASDLPGTTRDAVDVLVEHRGQRYVAIDTAGLRRKRHVQNAIELFGQMRARRSIERADVCLLLFDVSGPLSQVDKELGEAIEAAKTPCVIVGNKWDLAKEHLEPEDFRAYLDDRLPGLSICPLVFTTATERKRVWDVMRLAHEVHQQASIRVSTGKLNRVIKDAMRQNRPRIKKTVPKVYFATQDGVCPPKIILMVNKPALFDEAYRRYLKNRIRNTCGFPEVPVEMILRERNSQYINQERQARRDRVRRREKKARRAGPPEA